MVVFNFASNVIASSDYQCNEDDLEVTFFIERIKNR